MTFINDTARAITMWDFSWLERRWAGAGYEDWDVALSELAERGYDTVRIDAYPHLVAIDGERTWTLKPLWNQQAWGAQSPIDVQVLPQLIEFIRAAGRHGIGVALSTWFREDVDDVRMRITSPEALADVWIATLNALDSADVLGGIVYVDLCNEFPLSVFAPFLYGSDTAEGVPVNDPLVGTWTRESIDRVRSVYPDLNFTFSFSALVPELTRADVTGFDLLEPHLWMAVVTDYYDLVGYNFERYESIGFENVVTRGKSIYLADQNRFDLGILNAIDEAAEWSRRVNKPLITTECWSIVDYKDWPGLEWDWVMELNEKAVRHAAQTGRWAQIATSNFCGPQFVELWRDVDYHRRLTDLIHRSPVDKELRKY